MIVKVNLTYIRWRPHVRHPQNVADKYRNDGDREAGDDGHGQVKPLALLRHPAHQVVLLTARNNHFVGSFNYQPTTYLNKGATYVIIPLRRTLLAFSLIAIHALIEYRMVRTLTMAEKPVWI